MSTQNTQPETAPATAHTHRDSLKRQLRTHFAAAVLAGEMREPLSHDFEYIIDLSTDVALVEFTANFVPLISERDRLRDALEIAANAAGAQPALYSEEALRGLLITIEANLRAALANTTPSESARLRQINAGLMEHLHVLLWEIQWHKENAGLHLKGMGDKRVRDAQAALTKAKDAQGGQSS